VIKREKSQETILSDFTVPFLEPNMSQELIRRETKEDLRDANLMTFYDKDSKAQGRTSRDNIHKDRSDRDYSPLKINENRYCGQSDVSQLVANFPAGHPIVA